MSRNKKPKVKVVGYLIHRVMSEPVFQTTKPVNNAVFAEKLYSEKYVRYLKERIATLEREAEEACEPM